MKPEVSWRIDVHFILQNNQYCTDLMKMVLRNLARNLALWKITPKFRQNFLVFFKLRFIEILFKILSLLSWDVLTL